MPYSAAIKHVEPQCTDKRNGCTYEEPHYHGLACDDTCVECNGKCHPNCPAYSEVKRGNAAFEAFIDGAVDGKVGFVVYLETEEDVSSK
jgi:hypothetical protein